MKAVFYFSKSAQDKEDRYRRYRENNYKRQYIHGKQYTEICKKPPYKPKHEDSVVVHVEHNLPEDIYCEGCADIDVIEGYTFLYIKPTES